MKRSEEAKIIGAGLALAGFALVCWRYLRAVTEGPSASKKEPDIEIGANGVADSHPTINEGEHITVHLERNAPVTIVFVIEVLVGDGPAYKCELVILDHKDRTWRGRPRGKKHEIDTFVVTCDDNKIMSNTKPCKGCLTMTVS